MSNLSSSAVAWPDAISAIASLGQLLVALVGFYMVAKQLRHLNISLRTDVQGRLYTQNAEVRSLIASHPEVRKFFFDNCEIHADDENYPLVRTIAEMFANYFEHLAIHEKNLDDVDWNSWSKIIKDVYSSSPILRELIRTKSHWYCDDLHRAVGNDKLDDGPIRSRL